MPDVLTVLAQDHQEVKAMLAEFKRGRALEEMYFWLAVRGPPGIRSTLADEATGQEQEAKQVLASLTCPALTTASSSSCSPR